MKNLLSEDVPTKRERITFICDLETREALEKWAEEESRSLSNLVELIVKDAVKQKQPKPEEE